MKHVLISLLFLLPLVACQDESAEVLQPVSGVVGLSTQQGFVNAGESANSRAEEIKPTRFVLEVWQGANLVERKEPQDSASFALTLIPGSTYEFLMWADFGKDYYDVTSLKEVKINNPKEYVPSNERDAFAGAMQVQWTRDAVIEAKLVRPFDKLSVVNKSLFTKEYTTSISYAGLATQYNVATGKSSVTLPEAIVRNYTTAVNDSIIGFDYVLVPEKELAVDIKVDVDGVIVEKQTTLDTKSLIKNYMTNIKAEFVQKEEGGNE